MTEKVVIDPLTRIEGHLRIEIESEGKKLRKPGVKPPSSAVLKPSFKTVIRVMFGRLCSVSAGFVPPFTLLLPLPQ